MFYVPRYVRNKNRTCALKAFCSMVLQDLSNFVHVLSKNICIKLYALAPKLLIQLAEVSCYLLSCTTDQGPCF